MKKHLEFIDEKSAKFWEIAIKGTTITTSYGKIDSNGKSTTKELETEEEAQKEFEKQLRSKLKKGYEEVIGHDFQDGKTNEERYFTKEQLSNEDIFYYIKQIKDSGGNDGDGNGYTIDELVQSFQIKPINAILFTLAEEKPIIPYDIFSNHTLSVIEKKQINKFLPNKDLIKKNIRPVDKKLINQLKKQILENAKELSFNEAALLLKEKPIFNKIYDNNTFENVIYYEGDLNLPELNLGDLNIGCLIVNGNLSVENSVAINETTTCLFVSGDVKAKSIFTAGGVTVGGNLTLRDSLVGDYNDGSTTVLGNLEAYFVLTQEYYFEFCGSVNVKYAISSSITYDLDLGPNVIKCDDILLKDFFELLHPSFLACIDTDSKVFLNTLVAQSRQVNLWDYFEGYSLYRYISQGSSMFVD